MKRKIALLGVAIFVFMGSLTIAQAQVQGTCPHPNSPDGVHHFNACRPTGGGRTESLGTHSYLWGYDENNVAIYKSDCKLTRGISYCEYVCAYCGLVNPEGAHEHQGAVRHSVSH